MGWLSGYTYRKKCTVVATAAGAQTDYPLECIVGESSGAAGEDVDCENHCEDFPNDIRFTKEDGETKHDYWVDISSLEGTTPNRKVSVWIEVTSIPASGAVDFYMYYGNNGDSGESNGDDTFEFFDDFDGTSLDAVTSDGDVAVSNVSGKYEAWPAIAKNSAGDLFVVYRTCDSNTHGFDSSGKVVIRKSTDNGETWGSEVVVANAANIDDRTAGAILIFDDNGTETILVAYFECDASDNYYSYIKKSVDNGQNWGSKIALSSGNIRAIGGGPPILLSNGKILIPIYKSTGAIGAYVVESEDEGDTWTEYTVVTGSHGSEFSIIETKTGGSYTGGIYGLIRDDSSPYAFKKVASTDYGHTWGSVSDETDLPVDHGVPVVLFRLSNGNIVAIYSRDSGGVVYESSDECVNWVYGRTWLGSRTEGTYNSYYPVIAEIFSSKLVVVWCTNGDPGGSEVSDVFVNFMDYPFVDCKWVEDNGIVSVSDSKVTLDGTDQIRNPVKRSQPLQWRAKINFVNITDYMLFGMAEDIGDDWGGSALPADSFCFQALIIGKDYPTCYNDGVWTQNDTHIGTAGDHIYGVKWKTGEIKWYYDNGLIDTFTTNIPDEAVWAKFDQRTGTHKVDWIMISKYASPEPTWGSWGVEERAEIKHLLLKLLQDKELSVELSQGP